MNASTDTVYGSVYLSCNDSEANKEVIDGYEKGLAQVMGCVNANGNYPPDNRMYVLSKEEL